MFAATPLAAQNTELGFTGGGSAFGAEDAGMPAYVTFGAEGCLRCSSGVGMFAEYSHWRLASGGRPTRITSVDMVAAGLRLQGKRRIRPFFDAGFAVGWDRFEWPVSGAGGVGMGRGSHGSPGLVLGGGVAVHAGRRWYVRPQVRVYVLRGIHAGVAASVGAGYRF